MTTVLILLLLALAAALLAGEVRHLLTTDGLGHRPLPRSHRDEQARELTRWVG